jgi:hypothetical protein
MLIKEFRIDFYDRIKRVNTQRFTSNVRNLQIVNKHYQVYALNNQIYIYKNWSELYDCLKTS